MKNSHAISKKEYEKLAKEIDSIIDKTIEKNKIHFNGYKIVEDTRKGLVFKDGNIESYTKAKASIVTKALEELISKYPGLKIVENIESAEYKPPFSVSWGWSIPVIGDKHA
jgi:uncharacterized protein YggL (DUF469 family)